MSTSNLDHIKKAGRRWYLPVILGVVLILAGIWVFLTPASSFLGLSMLFAATFVVAGLLGTTHAITNRNIVRAWGWSLAAGVADLLIGILLFARPDITMIMLSLFVGFGILFRSIMAVIWSFEFKRVQASGWGRLLMLGVLGALFALILLWNPVLAGLTIIFYASLALIIIGGFQVYFGLKLKKLN